MRADLSSGSGREKQGAVVRMGKKENRECLEAQYIWEMSEKEEFRTAPMFLTWATGGAISQEELLWGKRCCM